VAEDRLTLAVIVPTYRRPDSLERCLRALARQHVPADRIVVVARNDDPETATAVRRFQNEVLRIDLTSVAEPGAVASIEAGLKLCEEDVVAHTDDDAEPRPDWSQRLLEGYGPRVGGVGGRDIIEDPEQASSSVIPVVGRLTWFGRLFGNHHLGVGEPRQVDVLKGVAMSLRRELWRLDGNLRGQGAQVHWEVGVCLRARRDGWQLIYDPNAKVDHFPGPRYDEDARGRPTSAARADAEWNYAYVLARNLSLWRLPFAGGYVLGVGTRSAPGLALALLSTLRDPRRALSIGRLSLALAAARLSGLTMGARERARTTRQ
jgi:GT2 family glycosyltransferase